MTRRLAIAALLLAGLITEFDAAPLVSARAQEPAHEVAVADVAAPEPSVRDAAVARRTLDSVLSDRRFARARGLSWQETLRRRLRNWFVELFARITPALGRRNVAQFVAWTAAGGAVLLLIAWLVRVALRRRDEHPTVVELAGQPVLPGQVLAQQAADLIRAGCLREGARAAYAAALRRLEEEGALRRDPSRTPREHLRALAPTHRRAAALGAMTAAFERMWYGARPGTADDGARLLGLLRDLECLPSDRAN